MSWSFEASGKPDHLREYVKRHVHHYLQDLDDDEQRIINHLVGHAIRHADPDARHVLVANGHETAGHYSVHVEVDRSRDQDTPLPAPVSDAPPAAEGSAT